MIHDAEVEVTCDGPGCYESVGVELPYKYYSYSGKSGFYDDDEEEIEEILNEDEGWIAIDGEHFCCEECAGLEEEE